jgi:hypothetical protein
MERNANQKGDREMINVSIEKSRHGEHETYINIHTMFIDEEGDERANELPGVIAHYYPETEVAICHGEDDHENVMYTLFDSMVEYEVWKEQK